MKKLIKYWTFAIVAFVLLIGFSAIAQVTGGDTPVAVDPVNTVSRWQEIIITVLYALASVFALLMTWIGSLIKAKLKANEIQAAATDAVTEGVTRTYTDFVRDLKAAGKFDAAAKKQAVEKALALAKDLAANDAVRKAIVAMGASLVEKIVTKLKGGTKLENGATK